MGDAFTSQGTTDRHTVSPEGQGTGAPSWPQEAPTLQTDSLVLTSGPQRGERVFLRTHSLLVAKDPWVS